MCTMSVQPTECAIPRAADVVIVGAGAAGAVVAARISEAGADSVLLVEAGPDYRSADTPPAVRGTDIARALGMRSLRWPALRAQLTEYQPRRPYACGRGVGGGSAINGQLAVRGTPADFDAWARAGCSGWSWRDVLPTFVHIEHDTDFGNHPGHGSCGPVPISRAPADRRGPVSTALYTAATDLGHTEHPDVNAEGSTGISPAAWHRSDGLRVSSNDSYLEPARSRPGLRIAGEHTVSRVLFASGRVRGVELVAGRHREVVSTPAVVLCAGAVYSPAVLLRSGVGPSGHLDALGIEIVAALPGVGAGLSDHPAVLLSFRLTDAAATRSRETESGCCLLRTHSGLDGDGIDDIQFLPLDRLVGPSSGGLLISLMRPRSTGSLRLRSQDATDDPVLDLRLLTDHGDLDRLRGAVQHAAELLDHPALREVVDGRPALPNADLDRWLQENCQAQYHPSGTCRMGPSDESGTVVDEEGRVLGVDGLWVADASVLPVPFGVPPYLSMVMVAERLAAAIQSRLRGAR
jgi:choline dehydrogenase-like flavoprotein